MSGTKSLCQTTRTAHNDKKYIDETCSSISASDDIFINRTIKIIPNPAGDNISIKNDNDSVIEQLKITDITGRIIISPTPSSHVIDISALKPGTYTLMAVTNSRLKVGKFVKI